MIVFDQFSVGAPPGVGVDWFVRFCLYQGMQHRTPGLFMVFRPPEETHNDFVISITRHPLDWLWIYFEVLQGQETRQPHIDVFREDLRGCQGHFDRFVRRYLEVRPGAISKMFDAYQADSVLRYEDFPHCCVELLDTVGVRVPAFSVGKWHHESPTGWMADRGLRRAVVKAEQEFCDRMEYW